METLDAGVPVGVEVMTAFRSARQAIIERVVSRSMEHQDEVVHHGEEAEQIITSGIQFTTQMLESAMAVGEIALLEDQLAWAMDRLPHDGVAPHHLLHRLRLYGQVVKELLPAEHAAQISPYIDWMVSRHQEMMQQG